MLKLQKADNERDFSAKFYESTVDSMHADGPILLFAGLCSCILAGASAYAYGSVGLGVMAALLPLLAIARVGAIVLYWRYKPKSYDSAYIAKWESIYTIGAGGHVLMQSAFCLWTFLDTPDGFGRIASLAGIVAYLVGIPGRNFASAKLVGALIVCAAVPIYPALLLAGGLNILLAAFVLTPFFASMYSISARLRGVFLDAALRAHEISKLAGRFDSALNNMPSGLAMLDEEGRVIVANHRLSDILHLAPDAIKHDCRLEDIFDRCARNGVLAGDRAREALTAVKDRIAQTQSGDTEFELADGRVLSLTVQKVDDGGAVVLFNDVTERNLAQARINELARFDTLTGLPNRAEFRERATPVLNARREGEDVALMFVDLDQFKQVNDTLGHAVGDQLLRAAAERLTRAVRSGDFVARLGGDEFVILLTSVRSIAQIEAIARAVVTEVSRPFDIAGQQLRVGASLGIARGLDVGCDLGALLRCADMALYQAKAEGRGAWRFFESSMEVRALARRELDSDLRLALESDQLEVYFQPIYSIAERRYKSCEALARWRHPTRGMVPPSAFVPVAEEIGLITKLDACVLRKACVAAAGWPSHCNIAVNLSAMSLESTEIIDTVRAALASSGLPPERLEIEVTETAVLRNVEKTRSILQVLRGLGVQISLDDFGTGYSSLSYLHSLPFNKIKIDRSFLAGLEKESRALKLLVGVIRLSKDLGLKIVVEGVETPQQYSVVTVATQVDEIQGYLFSPPVPQFEIAKLIGEKVKNAA